MPLLARRDPAPVHRRYTTYKQYLRKDFEYRCAYCDVHENEYGGLHNFHVDHFRPHSVPRFLNLKTSYTNLLYSCGVCNRHKSNDWPSDDPLIDGHGYLDPCEHDYEHHFCPAVAPPYHIAGLSQAANYMIRRLRLNRQQLLRMRQLRAEKRQRYEETLDALNTAIAAVEDALVRQAPETKTEWLGLRASLLAERDIIENEWATRWTPEFEAADYR